MADGGRLTSGPYNSLATRMDQPPKRVLVVEDDPAIRELISLHLKLEGYGVVPSENGSEALRLARTERFDLLVLDLMLPGLDGISLCAAIRRESANTDSPILMLTARREEADKVLGLETGADDYLTKPFGVREFIARVRALQRRHQRAEDPDPQTAPVIAGPTSITSTATGTRWPRTSRALRGACRRTWSPL